MTKNIENEIKILSDREHVRFRLPVYAGNTEFVTYEIPIFLNNFEIKQIIFIPALYKCVGEILDNSIDEFSQINIKNKTLKIISNTEIGQYTISDNGRGIPITIHETGKYTPEIALSSLRAGRNFTKNKENGVIGANGMGSSITNMCSSEFSVIINRDKKIYKQTFTDGALNISEPLIVAGPNTTGTEISFTLDPTIFKSVQLSEELMNNRAIELAFTNPNITVNYNEKIYNFKNGLEDIVKNISKNYFKFQYKDEKVIMEFFIIFDINKNIDEKFFTWVNSSFLFDGGICNTQFLNSFINATITYLSPYSKKLKCDVTKNDIKQNILILGNLKISNPEYDSQSKTRLTNPSLKKEMDEMITNQWKIFTKNNKEWFEIVLERAALRHHSSDNDKAIKQFNKLVGRKIPKLLDATSKNRTETKLYIVEGDSAKGQIADVRNSKTTAILPLMGKINNVYGKSPSELLQMGKITDLLTVIGLTPGKKAHREELHYGKIIIATDADPDGGDIFALLINLFFQFWPELFDPKYEAFIFRLVAPNIIAEKGNKRIHFTTKSDFDKVKSKYESWNIIYLKGLGSMIIEDWKMILSEDVKNTIPIIDDNGMKETLKLLFSEDVLKRKEWLIK